MTTSALSEAAATAGLEAGDLKQIIDAYNQVTERLQHSHETLTAEVQRLQRQLASANTALQRSKRLAALGEMAAGIAHEVRNPLASIHLYARMLESDLAARPEQADIARRISAAVRGLDAIVNDVLAFSREMRLRTAAGSAAIALDRAVDVVRPMIDAAGVRVVMQVDGEIDFEHDAELLNQALVNLVRNAVQAMEYGGVLTLVATQDETAVQLVVKDTGPGIKDEAVDRIFNPFFTTRATGTGLGLAIVHRIIDAHGGSIAVHNDPRNGGAVFTLSLPKAAALTRSNRRSSPGRVRRTSGSRPRS